MASAIVERILNDIKLAMKAQNKDRLLALRTLHSELKNQVIAQQRELTDEDALAVISKVVKQRQDSIEQFRKGGREDLVAKEQAQLDAYRAYQPEPLSEEEIAAVVEQVIAETGAVGKSDLGKVMKALMPRVMGRADGKLVNAIVSRKLG